jgi:hypothetical protein
MADDVVATQVAQRCIEQLPDRATWTFPGGYPRSSALCLVDAIQSMGVRYGSVEKVVRRYRDTRPGMAGTDGLPELLATFEERGGVDAWAREIGTKHRTSTRAGAPLKAAAIHEAAASLLEAGVSTADDLRALDPAGLAEVKTRWLRISGQRSGISWRYFLMLAGVPGVKADRMICRFVRAATGLPPASVTPQLAGRAVEGAADLLGVSPSALDHTIWRWQSGRT